MPSSSPGRRRDTPGRLVPDGGGRPPDEQNETDGIVLVVDDDEEFADTVAFWLDREWTTRVAYDGSAAVDVYDPEVDAVLLDRRMPIVSGDEALSEIRDRDGEARVAMMTAVDPDWDIVELDFDMYLEKPLTRDELFEAVDELLARSTYAREIQAMFSLSAKIGALRSAYSEAELADDRRFQRLQEEFDRLQARSGERLGEVDDEQFRELLQIVQDAP